MASVTRRPSTGGNRRATADAKILEATERLLAGGASFTELGVQRITAEAGVVRSTFYLHFRDKTQLLLRLIEPLADGAYDLISSTAPEKGLEGIVAAMVLDIRYYRERRHLLAAVLEVAGYDAVVREFWNAQIQRFTDLAEVWLRGEQEAGHTARDLEPATAARVLTWGGFQVLANHVLTGPEDQDEIVAREIALLEWYGAFRRPAQH
ncbi:TetR/AcrR family transcriptional regulator [Micromonospora sp. 15K316]|uniref:TetR/AcrR family transcriptional regulator n=1 Tax=Micromonospora sp. 15K316 TaxID=2530376 RepID=UPI00104D6791|nr:TetR/AcrR family transcriptional regulator [Micromonospora sp. 15K316]TDC39654.1 TetR/AcrR family transcriptional regulator [Micromonospora sp. 15K316]